MGLKEILEDIDRKTGSEVEAILQKADQETKRIRDDAESRARENEQKMTERTEKEAEQIMLRETSKANIAAKMNYDLAANGKIESAIGGIPERLNKYTKSARYKKLLNLLASKAADRLGIDCTILVREEDAQLLKQDAGFRIGTASGRVSGGLIAVSADGKMEVDYTLDALLVKLHDRVAQKLLGSVRKG